MNDDKINRIFFNKDFQKLYNRFAYIQGFTNKWIEQNEISSYRLFSVIYICKALHLEYMNDFLTIARFSEWHGVNYHFCRYLLKLGTYLNK